MKRLLIIISLFVAIPYMAIAQGELYFQEMTPDNYENLKLPPLSVLYENALTTPGIELLEQDRKIAASLVNKERMSWLAFFSVRAGYTYGKMQLFDYLDPMQGTGLNPAYQNSGSDQHYYNFGATVSINLHDLFDIVGRVRRQKLQVKRAEHAKLREYDILKERIAETYVKAKSGLSSLKVAAENLSLAEGRYKLMEERFKNRAAELQEVSEAKFRQLDYQKAYEEIRIQVDFNILRLEIFTNTPILTK